MSQGSKAAIKKSEIRILLKKREVSERINLDPSLPIKLTFKRDLSNTVLKKYTIPGSVTRNRWTSINCMVLLEFQTFPRSIQGHQILTRNSRKT